MSSAVAHAAPLAAPSVGAATLPRVTVLDLLKYVVLGAIFGVVLVKGEVASWYRIQEMFRFESFHMYGVLLSAVAVAAVSVRLLARVGATDVHGRAIAVPDRAMGRGYSYAIGGLVFGLGWGLAGACPGPIFALLGAGVPSAAVMLAAALSGTYLCGVVTGYLPY